MLNRWFEPSLIGVVLVALAPFGCRDKEPPPPDFVDLGTGDVTLLPTASTWKDPAIAQGRAEWPPFREPGSGDEEQPPPTTDEDEPDGVEAEIRDLVAGYNETAADGTAEDLLDYYAEGQVEAVKPLLESSLKAAKALQALQAELAAKLPDETDRVNGASKTLLTSVSPDLHVGDITIASDTEATAKVSTFSTSANYRFVVLDDEWYMEVVDKNGLASRRPLLEKALATYNEMLEGLRSGKLAPQDALDQLESAAADVKPAAQPPPGEQPADENQTPPSEPDAEGGG